MQAKPWQVVVIALSIVATGIATACMWPSGPDIPTRLKLINIASGQVYEVDLAAHRVALPARDPETGEYLLVPIRQHDTGEWFLTETAMGMVDPLKLNTAAVNLKTGAVRSPITAIKHYRPPNA